MPVSRRSAVLAALSLALAILAGPAGATPSTIIDVYPGQNALANAIAAADPGDTLRIHAGTYPEHVVINTANLTLVAAGDGDVTVDGGCATRIVIKIVAGGTTIDGLRVTGATEGYGAFPSEIAFLTVQRGAVRNTVVRDTCDAEYGINVYASGSLTIERNTGSGFSDAAIYIGFVTHSPAALVARANKLQGNDRGIIVEDSSGVSMSIRSNYVHDNSANGIYVTASSGIEVKSNRVMRNGYSGIELDPYSNQNVIRGNTALGHTYDLANDGGTGNCWTNNTYQTSTGDVGC